jgi:hypothetical protein
MEERLRLSRHSTAVEVDPTHYRRLIGSLCYLVHTRPDLALAIGFGSQFMERPTVEHQGAVKAHSSLCRWHARLHSTLHQGTWQCSLHRLLRQRPHR